MKMSDHPVIHHLDHSSSVELCFQAIDNGYPSVMIDASKDPLDENIRKVKQVVEYAHARGVHVEGEIGKIKGRDYEGTYLGDDFLANVADAVKLVKETNVDSLAVGIGTAHGFYEGKPELNFKRLAEINEAIDIPLVLHGGTGIPEEDVRRAIKNGINKVNVGTQIRFTYLSAVQKEIALKGPATHTIEIMHEVKKVIAQEVKAWIKICMADGKA
jgi:ketose-bisphosphate aldolase